LNNTFLNTYTLYTFNYVGLYTSQTIIRFTFYDVTDYWNLDDVSFIDVTNNNNIELLENGGFETSDITDWSVSKSDAFGIDGSAPHSGVYGLYNTGVMVEMLWQTVPTVVGRNYTLSFWLQAGCVDFNCFFKAEILC